MEDVEGSTSNTQAKMGEKGQEGKPKGIKNHHKQKHEKLLMPLMTRHSMS
jgi:hypothetical protein